MILCCAYSSPCIDGRCVLINPAARSLTDHFRSRPWLINAKAVFANIAQKLQGKHIARCAFLVYTRANLRY